MKSRALRSEKWDSNLLWKWKWELVVQSSPTLLRPHGRHVAHQVPQYMGFFRQRILEWVAIPFSRGSSWPRVWTWISHITGRFFTVCVTREALLPGKPLYMPRNSSVSVLWLQSNKIWHSTFLHRKDIFLIFWCSLENYVNCNNDNGYSHIHTQHCMRISYIFTEEVVQIYAENILHIKVWVQKNIAKGR